MPRPRCLHIAIRARRAAAAQRVRGEFTILQGTLEANRMWAAMAVPGAWRASCCGSTSAPCWGR
jgi:hypothetical protein